MLKLILLFQLILLASSVEIPPDLQELIDELHDTCLRKHGISDEEHINYDINNKDPKMMCYMKCLMLDSKWMSPDGEIRYGFIEDTAHPDIKDLLLKALNKCRNIEDGADLCEKSYNFNSCMSKADPENWFFI